MAPRHLLSIRDLGRSDLTRLLEQAAQIRQRCSLHGGVEGASGRILGSLFFQPSLRTEMSFHSAMFRLGGNVVTMSDRDTDTASYRSAEAFTDTVRVVSRYCDLLVIRHPVVGAPRAAAEVAGITVINAGDGIGKGAEHPSQALADLLVIKDTFGRLDSLNCLLVGEIHSRAARSLIFALSKFDGNTVALCHPPGFGLQQAEMNYLSSQVSSTEEIEDFLSILDSVDVLYHCGTRKSPETYDATYFAISSENIERMREDAIVMHPMPRRLEEIPPAIDQFPQARYFQQSDAAQFVRMAILRELLTAPD